MPRYKFAWENLPQSLLRALRDEQGLQGEPAPALRKLYGARPTPEFVKDNWSTLLERWLKSDRPMRLHVVEELRSRRLGDTTIAVRNAGGQMEYLRSCRNSATLRDVVVIGVIAAGESETPAAVEVPETPKKRSAAWQEFAPSLAASLSALQEDEYLIITLKRGPGFVQFAGQGAQGLRSEMISNAYLDEAHQLSAEAVATAVALGWVAPTGDPDEATPENDPDGSPNFHRDWPSPVSFLDAALLAANTLVDVLGVSHPGMLQYKAFSDDEAKIRLPTLGLHLEPDPPKTPEGGATDAEPATPTSTDSIRAEILAMCRQMTGDAELEPDADGDIPIQYDSTMVFVTTLGEPPTIRLFANVLFDAGGGPELINAVNNINSRSVFVKFSVVGDAVVASIDLFGEPFVARHVMHACGVLGTTVNDLDDQLQAQFGGRTFFGDHVAPKAVEGNFGYL